ncbi:MAG: gliding motility-associated protein GldE [Bacteroidia bacterium]|nr:gliding motility-associated protein GldE [Bacteroidia bacterium]
MIFFSACLSAAEVALFSLGPKETEELNEKHPVSAEKVRELLGRPKMLLATMLIGINLVNISTILASTYLFNSLFDFSDRPLLGFLIQVVGVTFILLLLSEVIPKVYSNFKSVQVAHRLVHVVGIMEKIFYPLSRILLYSSWITERLVKAKPRTLSVEELSEALELTTNKETPETEKKLLRGIVRFGKMDVKQIMKPRPDMVCADQNMDFQKLMQFILSSGFSRMPVYKDSVDKIVGILYIKDLLAYLDREPEFNWQTLVREPFFIPESKMIDDLLREFQGKKIHMAIIVDEYGGTTGLVTLEDIIEEIVGEINDEFDVEDVIYSKLDDFSYVFEGRVQLNDLCRILNLESDLFENVKGDSDTLAGFLLEYTGRIPKKGDVLTYKTLQFTIESADNRKIKRIKITLSS